jgi:hypothetical protein
MPSALFQYYALRPTTTPKSHRLSKMSFPSLFAQTDRPQRLLIGSAGSPMLEHLRFPDRVPLHRQHCQN